MSNDIFVREVNEEMRQERVRALWVRYGMIAIALAVLAVAAAGGYVLFERYRAGLAAADGDRLIAAGSLIAEGKTDEAKAALEALAGEGTGSYPDLARLRLADMMQAQDPAGAVARYDEVANDTGTPAELRDMASIRAAYILIDTGSLADVRARVERLTGDGVPLRYPAREAVALAAWKAGDVATARPLFTQLQDDLGTPQGIKRRAGLMLELIAASTAPEPAAADATPAPAATVDPEAEIGAPVPPAVPMPASDTAPPAAPTPDAAATPPTPATPEAGSPAVPAAPSIQAPAAPQPPA